MENAATNCSMLLEEQVVVEKVVMVDLGAATDGTANTGGGGGGGGRSGTNKCGGAGGSGIVIIRYKFQ